MPRCWNRLRGVTGVLWESNLSVAKSRLALKVLVFESNRAMRKSFRAFMGVSMGRDAAACLQVLGLYSDQFATLCPRYYAAMFLSAQNLTVENIVHESVHAAYAYRDRVRRRMRWPNDEEPEEGVCYPAGFISGAIIRELKKAGFTLTAGGSEIKASSSAA